MADKFKTVMENAMRRYQNNTLIVGDRIKLIDNIFQHEWSRGQAPIKLERIKDLIESGDNIRISAVKSARPVTAQTGHFEVVDEIYYDIVRETAPGLYSQVFTVPAHLVEWQDDYPNLAGSTPTHQIKQDPSVIKPEPVDGEDNEMGPKKQTGTDSGDRALLGKNVDISTAPAANSYTAKYLEG